MRATNKLRVIELLFVLKKESEVLTWHYWQHNIGSLQVGNVPHPESTQLGLPWWSGQQDFTVHLPTEPATAMSQPMDGTDLFRLADKKIPSSWAKTQGKVRVDISMHF